MTPAVVYRGMWFTRSRSVLPEMVVQRLPDQRFPVALGRGLEAYVREHVFDDPVGLHGAFDLIGAGVGAGAVLAKEVVERGELVDVAVAEVNRRVHRRIVRWGHARADARRRLKRGGCGA